MFNRATLKTCIEALANDEWISLDLNPHVEQSNPRLFYVSNRDFLTVNYSSLIVWPANPHFTLDFEIGELASAAWLKPFGSDWYFPCNAKITHMEHGEVASISGILTFNNWIRLDEHENFAASPDYENPLLAAIESSVGFESARDNSALVNAARLVLQLEPEQSSELQEYLWDQPKDL